MNILALTSSPPFALVGWLLTYTVHSTLILSGVWLLTRRGTLARPTARATLWKTGAVVGVLTATGQTVVALGLLPSSPHTARWVDGGNATSGQVAQVFEEVQTQVARLAAGEARRVTRVRLSQSPSELPSGLIGSGQRQVRETIATCSARQRERLRALPRMDRAGAPLAATPEGAGLVQALLEDCGSEDQATWPWWILGLWLAGLTLSFARDLSLNRALARALDPIWPASPGPSGLLESLVRRAGQRPVRLLEAPGLGTPVALSGRRIVLPAHAPVLLEAGEMYAVLAHELAHLDRHDPFWLVTLRFLQSLFFFQPLNRVALLEFQEASEYLSDAWAVRHAARPLDLARSLEKVSSWHQPVRTAAVVSAMARGEAPVVDRVRRVLARGPSGEGNRFGAMSGLLLLPALLLPHVPVPTPGQVRVVVVREMVATTPSPVAETAPSTGSASRLPLTAP